MHARQLHHDAVYALLLNHGFGHTQFIHTVVQGVDVLLERVFLNFQDGFRRITGQKRDRAIRCGWLGSKGLFLELQLQRSRSRIGAGAIGKFQRHVGAFEVGTAGAQVFFTQKTAQLAYTGIGLLRHGGLDIDLHHQVDTTAQIQTQIHGQGVDVHQPFGRAGAEVERDGVALVAGVRVERFFDDVAGPSLGIDIGKAHTQGVGITQHQLSLHLPRLQGINHYFLGFLRDFDHGFGARDLYRRRFAKKIGQGVKRRPHKNGGDDEVFPQRIAVHKRVGCKKLGSRSGQLRLDAHSKNGAYFIVPLGSTWLMAAR